MQTQGWRIEVKLDPGKSAWLLLCFSFSLFYPPTHLNLQTALKVCFKTAGKFVWLFAAPRCQGRVMLLGAAVGCPLTHCQKQFGSCSTRGVLQLESASEVLRRLELVVSNTVVLGSVIQNHKEAFHSQQRRNKGYARRHCVWHHVTLYLSSRWTKRI